MDVLACLLEERSCVRPRGQEVKNRSSTAPYEQYQTLVAPLVVGSGRMLVRDVIKLEELEKRWPHLQRSICGLRGVAYGTDPTATARRNPSAHKHYSYYYDEVARRIVERYVAADLQAFGYKFEDIVDK